MRSHEHKFRICPDYRLKLSNSLPYARLRWRKRNQKNKKLSSLSALIHSVDASPPHHHHPVDKERDIFNLISCCCSPDPLQGPDADPPPPHFQGHPESSFICLRANPFISRHHFPSRKSFTISEGIFLPEINGCLHFVRHDAACVSSSPEVSTPRASLSHFLSFYLDYGRNK